MPPARPTRSLARLAVAGLAALALVGAGCAGDEDVAREDFEDRLYDRMDEQITEAQATCLTDRIYDEFDQDQINTIVWAATEDELSASTQETLRAINEECVGDASLPSSTTTTTTESQTGTSESTTTTGG